MNKLKNKNGITLVALIITIIVLLILAMVSISLVMNSGIINKSKTAVDKYSQEEVQEQIKLAYSEWQMGQYTGETRTAAEFMQAKLNSIYGTGAVTDVTETNGTFEVTFANGKGYSYNVSTGTAAKVVKWNDNGNNTFTHSETGQKVEVGDTVYYNSGVAAYEGEGANQGKWGILGVENGKLLIMSKENVATVELRGKQDYLTDGTTKLNNACSSFKNPTYADSVRSVKVEDINKITGYTAPDPVTYTYTMVNGKVKRNDQTSASSTTKFEDINGKTLPTDSPIEVTVNSYSYGLTNYLTSGNKVHNLLKDNNNYYWLDSPYVDAGTGYALWGFRLVDGSVSKFTLWDSGYGTGYYSYGVRAVVSLKSDIQLSESSSEGWTIQ